MDCYGSHAADGSWTEGHAQRWARNDMNVVLTVDDMVAAFRVHYGARTLAGRILCAILGVSLLALSAFCFLFNRPIAVAFGALAIVMAWLAIKPLCGLRRQIRKQWDEMGKTSEDVDIAFDDEGLSVRGAKSEGTIKWTAFTKWKEGGGYVLLYQHRKFFHIVPIGQFDSETAARLRQILSSRISNRPKPRRVFSLRSKL